jgi:hypothetical protein
MIESPESVKQEATRSKQFCTPRKLIFKPLLLPLLSLHNKMIKKEKTRRRVIGARIPSMNAKCLQTILGHPSPINHSPLAKSFSQRTGSGRSTAESAGFPCPTLVPHAVDHFDPHEKSSSQQDLSDRNVPNGQFCEDKFHYSLGNQS